MSPSAKRRERDKVSRAHHAAGTSLPKATQRRSTTAEIRDVVVSEIRDMRVQIEEHRKHVKSVGLVPDYLANWDAQLEAPNP